MHRLGWGDGPVGQMLAVQCEDLSSDLQLHIQFDTVVHVHKPRAPRIGQETETGQRQTGDFPEACGPAIHIQWQTIKDQVLNKWEGEN